MASPYVISVILNTNRRDDTLACLASLHGSDYQNHKVIVLDNMSTDGSVEAIASRFPAVQIIPLSENRGYAGNNNVGIREALAQGADWVFVLNEDTLLAPDCISRLIEVAEGNDSIGIAGPMVYYADEPEVIQSAGGKLGPFWRSVHVGRNEVDTGQYAAPRPVEWISGCAILVRRAVIEHAGALDERFFYYWEETEWCLRARRQGWTVTLAPAARLWHKGVQRHYRPSAGVTYYATRNRFLMLAKHHAPMAAWAVAWGVTCRTLASWSIRPKYRSMHEHRDAMWQGVWDFLQGRDGMRQPRPVRPFFWP